MVVFWDVVVDAPVTGLLVVEETVEDVLLLDMGGVSWAKAGTENATAINAGRMSLRMG